VTDPHTDSHPKCSEEQPNASEGPFSDPLVESGEGEIDSTMPDPPLWIQQASLSELLLWRLGLPVDREAMEREYAESQEAIDLKPPITTRKVADAIAHLSLQLINGEIDATTAKTSLYALQTLLTALRLQIVEEKKAKDISEKKAHKATQRRKSNANRKR
jgi:predicted P-loop ATPase/GTPase